MNTNIQSQNPKSTNEATTAEILSNWHGGFGRLIKTNEVVQIFKAKEKEEVLDRKWVADNVFSTAVFR